MLKVITLKQPWATLVAEGIKKLEFRSWKTNYRGKFLIHAGKGIDKKAMEEFNDLNFEFPTFKIMAEVEIFDCIKLDKELNEKINSENNIAYGFNERVGYAWKLKNIKKINSDKVISGKQGFWYIEKGDF